MSIELAKGTMFLKPDRTRPEFRGPTCPAWEKWWKKIATHATIDADGFLHMDNRIVGIRESGDLYGDPDIFGSEEYLGSGIVLIKNHLNEDRLESLIGITNGLTVFQGCAFTVDIGVGKYYILRAAQQSEQQLLKSFFARYSM